MKNVKIHLQEKEFFYYGIEELQKRVDFERCDSKRSIAQIKPPTIGNNKV